jgi:hypothetical protein
MCNWILHPFGCAAGSAASGVIGDIASAVQTGETDLIGSLSTLWVGVPTPTLGSPTSSSPSGATLFLWDTTSWYTAAFAVMGLLIAAIRMAWSRKMAPAEDALKGLINLVIVTGCAVPATVLATQAGDAFSNWILELALGVQAGTGPFTTGDASAFDTAMKNVTDLSEQGSAQMLIIVIGLLAILSCIVQVIVMIARYALLGLTLGALPVTAGISGTAAGKTAFRKNVGWLVAFVLYKPVAALIYGFSIVEMKSDSFVGQLAGLTMIVMACVAMPALMRFVTPLVSGTTGGGGGAGAALAGAGVAAGARMVMSSAGQGAGGGGGGSSPAPSGPSGSQSAAGGASQQPSGGGGSGGSDSGGPDGAESGAGQTASTGGGASGAVPAAGQGAGAAGVGGGGAAAGGGAAGAGAAAGGPVGAAVAAGTAVASSVKSGVEGQTSGGGGASGAEQK